MNLKIASIISLVFFVLVTSLSAEARRSIRIEGFSEATVNNREIDLSDIASIASEDPAQDDAVVALKNIKISKSPEPGETLALNGATVVQKLKSQGVKLDNIGYLFPQTIKVSRAYRELDSAEVKESIQKYLTDIGSGSEVKELYLRTPLKVATGAIALEAFQKSSEAGERQLFRIKFIQEGNNAGEVDVAAKIERWAEVPVSRRVLGKGELILDSDLVMARMNIGALPKDAALDPKEIIGLEVKKNISPGEVLRKETLNLPLIIKAGERVTLRYRSGALTATATGSAIDNGSQDSSIRVKNEASKKIVSGRVIEAGLVEVTQ